MGKSMFKDGSTYDNKTWVVTIVNTGEKFAGHAALIIEGEMQVHDGRTFPKLTDQVWFCDINACSLEVYLTKVLTQTLQTDPFFASFKQEFSQSQKNIQYNQKLKAQMMCFVRCFAKDRSQYDTAKQLKYRSCSHTSWALPKEKVIAILGDIQREEKEVQDRAQDVVSILAKHPTAVVELEQYFKLYSMYGQQSLFTEDSHAINCVNWCEEKLKLAGIKPQSHSSDPCIAFPESHAKQASLS